MDDLPDPLRQRVLNLNADLFDTMQTPWCIARQMISGDLRPEFGTAEIGLLLRAAARDRAADLRL